MDYPKDVIHCKGRNCCNTTENESAYVEMREDAYGIPTGYYCDNCYENNYPYKKNRYHDYLDAGEYLEDVY